MKPVDVAAIAEQAKAEFAQTIAAQLMQMTGDGSIFDAPPPTVAVAPGPISSAPKADGAASGNGYIAPWIDSAQCTSCDECTEINAKIFAYDDHQSRVRQGRERRTL